MPRYLLVFLSGCTLIILTSCKHTFYAYPVSQNLPEIDSIYLEPIEVKLNPIFYYHDSFSLWNKELKKQLGSYEYETEKKLRGNFKVLLEHQFDVTEILMKEAPDVDIETKIIKKQLDSLIFLSLQQCPPLTDRKKGFLYENGLIYELSKEELACYQASSHMGLSEKIAILDLNHLESNSRRYHWLNLVESDLFSKRERFKQKFDTAILPSIPIADLEVIKYYSLIYDTLEKRIVYFNFLTSRFTRGLFYPHPEKKRTWRIFLKKIKNDLGDRVVIRGTTEF